MYSITLQVQQAINVAEMKIFSITGESIMLAVVKKREEPCKIEKILRFVGEVLEVPRALITTKCRKRELVDARRIALKLIETHCEKMTLYERAVAVGYILPSGKPDHSSVVHATQKFNDLMNYDEGFSGKWKKIQERLKTNPIY